MRLRKPLLCELDCFYLQKVLDVPIHPTLKAGEDLLCPILSQFINEEIQIDDLIPFHHFLQTSFGCRLCSFPCRFC